MNNTKTINDYLDRLEALRKEALGIKDDPAAEALKTDEAYARAFRDMLHTGMPSNALKKGSDGSGGYLIPDTFEKKIVRALTEKSLLRKLGTVIKTNKRMKIPTIVSNGKATWVPEGEPVQFTEPVYGEIVLDAYKLADKVIVSDEMLEDADFDVEDYIRQMFVESISEAEERAFFSGDGNGKPLGILHQAEVGAETAKADYIDFDDIINLIHSVKEPYRKNAVLVLSQDAVCKLRLQRLYRGHPGFDDPLKDGDPELLMGCPYYICDHLDRVEGGGIAAMYGDFSYFWIGERGKRSTKRLVERYADNGQVAYITSERIDAKLVLPEAVKLLKVKA